MKNFNELIKEYDISIPIIQRDYAQGRNNIDVVEIRDNFLNTIDNKLSNNSELHLDFIYGSIKKDKFIPLDGQQRLTTLYLLHFYFGKKEGKDIEYLSKFTYETRSSSREFCEKLVSADIDFSLMKLSEQIRDSHWFLPYWENDPTIKSMFVMLDSIHNKFIDKSYFDKLNNITFEFFELEKFGLDDDLYIKMNARGKPLTPFENFKASFETIVKNIDKKLKDKFSEKIDTDWTDIFWEYKDKNYLIDEAFMNYFYYITEMLNVKDKRLLKSPSQMELKIKLSEIYNNVDNIKFLFSAIDNLSSIRKAFKEIFSTEYQKDKVALFDNDIDLIKKVIEGKSISLEHKIIIFVVVEYFIKYQKIDKEIKDIVRVVRNLLNRIRSLKQSKLYYTQNLGYENINAILGLVDSIVNSLDIYANLPSINNSLLKNTAITKESLKQEIDKAKLINSDKSFRELIFELEDFKYLKGDIYNFLIDDISKFENYKNAIIDIYTNSDDTKIIQAMLTIGDDYLLWRGWAGGSSKYFLGKKGYWEIILTADIEGFDIRRFFLSFLDDYLKYKSLDKMKNNFLTENVDKNWIYYFIKYNEMIDTESQLSRDNNLYAWYDDFSLEKMGGNNLNAYHINPYIRTLALKNNLEYFVCKNGYSFLSIDKKIEEIYSIEEGWEIKFSSSISKKNQDELIKKYNLKKVEDDFYIFKIGDKEDRIEEMSEFIKNLP